MKCSIKNRDEIIVRYLNRELSDVEVEAFQEHFFNCDICFEELRFKQDALELIEAEGDKIFAERQVESQQKTRDWNISHTIRNIVQELRTRPSLSLGLTVIVLLLAAGIYFMTRTANGPDLLASLNYGSAAPYEYSPAETLRGEEDILRGAEHDPAAWAAFTDRFQKAMLHYRDLDYEAAIRKLARLEPAAGELGERDLLANASARALRDYYFYRGLSHLGLAGDNRIELPRQERQKHLAHALELLAKSREIAQRNALNEPERESYFLGIVHAASGNPENALRELKKVGPDSRFFNQSEEFARRLSR